MTIGQRIKEARLERHMTQQELVGDYITRNMLSKIENDAATPSVRTLEYIAQAMGLPPGAFLSDSSDDADRLPVHLLERMLERDSPDFPRKLADARRLLEEAERTLLLLEAEYFLKKGQAARAEAILADCPPEGDNPRSFQAGLLRGQALLALGRAADAAVCLRGAEALSAQQPAAQRAKLYEALETCYREQGDFQKAYYYAKKEA